MSPKDAPESEATSPPRHVVTAEFTGRGGEYLRIWVVNLLLTANANPNAAIMMIAEKAADMIRTGK